MFMRSKINNSAVKTLYLYNKILKLYNNYENKFTKNLSNL